MIKKTGLKVPFSAKHILDVRVPSGDLILVSQKDQNLLSFKINKSN
jgi:hypothetical protein